MKHSSRGYFVAGAIFLASQPTLAATAANPGAPLMVHLNCLPDLAQPGGYQCTVLSSHVAGQSDSVSSSTSFLSGEGANSSGGYPGEENEGNIGEGGNSNSFPNDWQIPGGAQVPNGPVFGGGLGSTVVNGPVVSVPGGLGSGGAQVPNGPVFGGGLGSTVVNGVPVSSGAMGLQGRNTRTGAHLARSTFTKSPGLEENAGNSTGMDSDHGLSKTTVSHGEIGN